MREQRILILESDSHLRTSIFRHLDRKGYNVITAQRIDEAKLLCSGDMIIDLAVINFDLADGMGREFAHHLQRMNSKCQVIFIADQASSADHSKANFPNALGEIMVMKKPIDPQELGQQIDRMAESALHRTDHTTPLRHDNIRRFSIENIVGVSDSIQQVLDLVQRVADADANILIQGESGTGKELIAKAIHYNSLRANQPFVAINCGAIPAELLESELFGHVKGAFTGAIANRAGRFELADGGTIFLDEIGDLEASLQVKLLRVLQEKSFEPVGSTRTMAVDVRVIAATNINLEEAVEKGKFREDLFYRLNVIPISVPALRERRTDIPLLVQHFLKIFNRHKNRGITGFADDAMECLMNYPWPGNIRELENLIERLSILKGTGLVEVQDLPAKYKSNHRTSGTNSKGSSELVTIDLGENGMDFNSAVDAFENSLIMRALEKTGWNRNQAALLLRLNRTTLVEKIKKKGLKPASGEDLQHDASLDVVSNRMDI